MSIRLFSMPIGAIFGTLTSVELREFSQFLGMVAAYCMLELFRTWRESKKKK